MISFLAGAVVGAITGAAGVICWALVAAAKKSDERLEK